MQGRSFGLGAIAVAAAAVLVSTQLASARVAKPGKPPTAACSLGKDGKIQHVIYIQFDNTHWIRDHASVPSDLEQMPNLLNFMKQNGTFLTNDHTILISHTGGGILSSLTGLYPDRHGQAVSNSYGYFRPDGSVGFSSTFKYWTDQTDPVNDPKPNMVNNDPASLGGTGSTRMAPGPWVPYTRAGCDVGNVGTANTVLENNNAIITSTGATDPTGDMTKVFGENSPEWLEGKASQLAPAGTAARALAQTDFVGIAIHCAQVGICTSNATNTANARDDKLPDEAQPGGGGTNGYTGFKALFGAKYVNQAIANSPCVNDTTATPGHPSPIKDPFGQCGFPGFDGMYAKNTLGEVAQMQEAGVPVTFAYISDAHDNHGNSGDKHIAYGPGEAGYVQQLRDYDKAFGDFFARLKGDGITKDNTLFVFTVEESDHFAGTAPDAPCDGVTTPCTYANGHVSEVNGDLKRIVARYNVDHGTSATTNFSVHSDMAPNVYINKTNPSNPTQDAANARTLEQVMSDIDVQNPLTGDTENLFVAMADPVEEKILHMVTPDPARTPTFTPFARGDYFLNASSSTPCDQSNSNINQKCTFIPGPGLTGFNPNQTFAWNHGGIQPEVATTWIGYVGPGVQNQPEDNGPAPTGQENFENPPDQPWTDHADIRPTMLALLGLKDDYVSDGRVVTEILDDNLLPKSLHQHHGTLEDLGQAWKQINASFGQFSMDTLAASTGALASTSPGDTTYTNTENALAQLGNDRDALASQIRLALWNAEFGDQSIDEQQAKDWIDQANALLDRAGALAAQFSSASDEKQLSRIKHFVVIYEENHSFDNLFGGWEGVNGLNNVHKTVAGDHVTQVDQNGAAYGCLKQLDVNLTSPPLPGDCTDVAHGITSHFTNTWFRIDDFIQPSDKTCPPITNAFAFGNGISKNDPNPPAGTRSGGCTRDLVHEFYQEQYQLHGGAQDRYMSGSDSAGTTMGTYDTTLLPLYKYLHETGHPHYAIADNFFQAAFGGSFLNHQWLIAAATPVDPTGSAGGAHAGSHSVIDTNGMPTAYPLYTPTGPVARNPLTVSCTASGAPPAPAQVCGNWAVNTMQPTPNPQGAFSQILPLQSAPTIGDRLTDAGLSWAWYSGGWANANGDVGHPGYTNGTVANPNTTNGCYDPNVDPGVRAGVPVAHWPRCPDALFQYHHQPFNYFANYAPGQPGRANLQDEANFDGLVDASDNECQLRDVSFVKPIGEENEHPGYASTPDGNTHLTAMLRAIENSACAKDTMVIVTYDEFGGQWDHVSPPGQGNNNGPHDVWGPGTRIPALVIAPHLKGDFVVDSTEHDTTSILATLEHRYGLDPLGTRDAAVADLSSVFDARKPKKDK